MAKLPHTLCNTAARLGLVTPDFLTSRFWLFRIGRVEEIRDTILAAKNRAPMKSKK